MTSMHARLTAAADRAFFLAAALLSFSLVLVRAWELPPVHDAARAFFLYNQTGRIWPGTAVWDAANHLLSTWAAQLAWPIFGPSLLSLRLFSILSALLYYRYAWAMGAWVQRRPVRWLLWAALLFPPLLLEFFSLYRGYGPGLAFLLMGIYHLAAYARTGLGRHGLLSMAGMLLGAYSTLTLLIPWCTLLALLPVLMPRVAIGSRAFRARAAAWLFLGLLPLAYLAWFALELGAKGQLYYGSDAGFWHGSVASVWTLMFGGWPDLPVLIAATVGLFAVACAVAWRMRRTAVADPLVLVAVLLASEIAGTYLLHGVHGTLFPIDRAAMHLVLFFVLLFSLAVDHLSRRRAWAQWALLPLLAFPWYTLTGFDPGRTTIWPDDPIGGDVHAALAAFPNATDRALAVGASPFLRYSWALQNLIAHRQEPPLQEVPQGSSGTDLLVLRPSDAGKFPGYHRLGQGPADRVALFARNEQLRLEPILDTLVPPVEGRDQWFQLWQLRTAKMPCTAMLIEVNAVISSPECPLEALLVYEAGKGTEQESWANLELAPLRTCWKDDTLRYTHLLERRKPDTDWISVYFWNIREQPMKIGPCRLRAWCIAGHGTNNP